MELDIRHGTSKYQLSVPSKATVADLKKEIKCLIKIPPEKQKIIFRGISLLDENQQLVSYNIKSGSKLMILGQQFDPYKETCYQDICTVEKNCISIEQRFQEAKSTVDGIVKGFLSIELQEEALNKASKIADRVAEEFIRQIEILDSIALKESQKESRSKRKSIINQIQKALEEVDDFHDTIKQQLDSILT